MCLLFLFDGQMSGRASRTSSAVRTTAVCLAAGNVTMTMTAGTTLMRTNVVCSLFAVFIWLNSPELEGGTQHAHTATSTGMKTVIYEVKCDLL